MSTIVQIADAVAIELNNQAWSFSFAAERQYRPRFEIKELDELHVTVVPRSILIDATARGDDSYQCQIDIAIQKRLKDEYLDEIESLIGLAEEIVSYFSTRRLSSMPDVLCIKVEADPLYAVEHLDELRCFTSIISLMFRYLQ